MNWTLRLLEFVENSPDAKNSTKEKISDYCDKILLENTDMFDSLVNCLQYMQESAKEDEYKESKKVISEFYGENKEDYISELMEKAYVENAHRVVSMLGNLRELGDIDEYTESYANEVIKDTLSFQYYPKVQMGEIRLSAFMDNMVELMQLYQPAKMIYGEDPEESDSFKCCMSSYEKARKTYEEYKNFTLNDIPTVQLESYANNSDDDEVTMLFESFAYNKMMRNRQKVENKYDLKPFPLSHASNWKVELESVSINNIRKYVEGFDSIPAYEVSGGVYSVSESSDEWKTLKKAVLSYMDAGKHSDCVAVGRLDIKTKTARLTTFLKKEKTDQNAKVDTGKLGLDDIDKGTKIIEKTYRRNGQPFFAYVQVGDITQKAQAWILYKDTIAKRHCMYYMAHALCALNLSSPTVYAWAKKQLQEFNSMKNPYGKDGKTIVAKESDDMGLGDVTKELDSISKQLNDASFDKMSNEINNMATSNSSSASEATHIGTMLPQQSELGDGTIRDDTPSLYVPENDKRPDTKYIRWDDNMFGLSDTYKINKANNIIDAARLPIIQETSKRAREILENVSTIDEERTMQESAINSYINTVISGVKFCEITDSSDYKDSLTPMTESVIDAIDFYLEKCYVDETGDFRDILEFTTAIADELLEEKTNLPSFYTTEAADVDLDMKGIVKILNEKGYKVKYSCGGHPASPKKEDRDRNNIYYGKLYTTARLVFDGKYKFQVSPKGWHFNPTTEKNNPPRTSLYVDEITYDNKKGSGNQAFLAWKNKYMSALRTWVMQIPDADKMRSREADAVAAKISDSSKGKSPEEVKKESVMTESVQQDNPLKWIDAIFNGENPFNI